MEVLLTTPKEKAIYTVGHSNHTADDFVKLLQEHSIELVVDVRSSPYSRYVPHANRESLMRFLASAGIGYRWLGALLGGKPEGVVGDYDLLRASPGFQKGIDILLDLAVDQRTAIMCSEGEHRQCHRYKLITPTLLDQEVKVLHVQPDGSIVDESQQPKQLALF